MYPYIIEAIVVIAHKLHVKKYLNWSDWDNESRRRAASALAGISIVKSLLYLRGPPKKIQGRSLDLYNVVGQVMVARDDLLFALCFEYASEIAGLINVMLSMPPVPSHQQHRPNTESNKPFDYYRVNVCLPFVNHIINGIDVLFDKYGKIVLAMPGLVPSVIAENDVPDIDILNM